MKDNFQFKLLE